MKGTTYKRCRCRDAAGVDVGATCPRLRRKDGTWNPRHGTWAYRLELEPGPGGKRRTPRKSGFASEAEAQEALDDAKEKARRGINVAKKTLLRDEFDSWLKGKKKTRSNTNRGYESIGRVHLKPHLGHIEIGKLRVDHVNKMFDAIDAQNELTIAANEERALLRAHARKAGRARDYAARREALAQIADLPAWKKPTGAVTQQRIRDCLRNFLNATIAEGLISVNVAALAELPEAKKSRPIVWTTERVEAWRASYRERVEQAREEADGPVDLFGIWFTTPRPSRVMVWAPEHTGVFLDHAERHRLYAAYHLIAFTGLRRGETCGAGWPDLGLETAVLAVRTQLVQLGWKVQEEQPKTDASDASVALDKGTLAALRAHRKRQAADQLEWGDGWVESGKIFTREDGAALHPATLTIQFYRLAYEAGLPPIRLHDLRHGAATLALAAGVDIKVVSAMLRHSSTTITADLYTSVLPDVAREAAEAVAAMVPRRAVQGKSRTGGHPGGTPRRKRS